MIRLLSIMVVVVLTPINVLCYETNVHREITKKAIAASGIKQSLDSLKLSLDTKFANESIDEWIEDGSDWEDAESRWLNHFYDPTNGQGLTVGGVALGEPSLLWGKTSGYNPWSWLFARSSYRAALISSDPKVRETSFAKLFRGLGQMMHLVQDLSVPAHVRNDAHPYNPYSNNYLQQQRDMYEKYTKDAVSGASGVPPLKYDGFPAVDITKFNTFDSLWKGGGEGLAEYTNHNFFSKDTIFKNYPQPAKEGTNYSTIDSLPIYVVTTDGSLSHQALYISGYGKQHLAALKYFAQEIINTYPDSTYVLKLASTLDNNCHKEYSDILIPRAVGYSVGLLNYFFRGKVNMEKDPQNAGKYTIKNESGERMEGTFALYYDDASGNRNAVSGASWTLTINPNSTSTPVTFTEPISPAPKEKGKYILVFQGKLGAEERAVVGRMVKLVTVEPKYSISIKAIDPPHFIDGYDWISYYFNGYEWVQYKPWEGYLGLGTWLLNSNQMLTGVKDSVTLEITLTDATNSNSLNKEIMLSLAPASDGSGTLSETIVRTNSEGKASVIFTKGDERTGRGSYNKRAPRWRYLYVTASLIDNDKITSNILLMYRDPLTISYTYWGVTYPNCEGTHLLLNTTWTESYVPVDWPWGKFPEYCSRCLGGPAIVYGDGSSYGSLGDWHCGYR